MRRVEGLEAIQGTKEDIMKNPFVFLQEARNEVRKVVWPTRNETMVSTIMVLIMVTLMMLFFGIADFLINFGLRALFNFSIFS